jgi:xeroderma pigmentosum group C-complementing protein
VPGAGGSGGATPAGGRRRRGESSESPASAAGGTSDEGAETTGSAEGGGRGGRGRGRVRGRGRGRGRGRKGRGGGDESGADAAAEAAAAAEGGGEQAAAAAAVEAEARAASRNRGDEEFERQLEMAMAATAAEAAAAASARGDGGAAGAPPGPGAGLPPRPGTGGRGALRRLAAEAAEARAAQQAGGGASGSGGGGGQAWSSDADGGRVVPRCWAEVYLGSSATGRWVSLDGVTGWFDSVDRVDRDTARPQPLAYVVAAQGGAAKDVTRRYSRNYMAALKHRDEEWWAATMRAARGAAGAHLPLALRAAVEAAGAAGGPGAGMAAAAAAQGPATAAGTRSSGGDVSVAAAAAGAPGADAAALLAKREEAELSHREAAHRRGVPATIDAFKGHSLYVLQRHIGKYQARPLAAGPAPSSARGAVPPPRRRLACRAPATPAPAQSPCARPAWPRLRLPPPPRAPPPHAQALPPDAKPLGLHKKEPYFDRSELSDLHTAERWRREHWRDVRADELERPAKVVKKRAAPGAKRAANPELDEMAAVGGREGSSRGWRGGEGTAGNRLCAPACRCALAVHHPRILASHDTCLPSVVPPR